MSISFFFPKSTYISNNHVIHRFFNVIDIGTNSARKGTTRRLINSRRGVVSADLIRAWAQGGCWKLSHYYPTYEGLDSHHKGVWCRELPPKDEPRTVSFLSLSLFPRVTLVSSSPSLPIHLLLFPCPGLRCSNFVLRRNSP